jgi:geranylgeranyl reductase family protein
VSTPGSASPDARPDSNSFDAQVIVAGAGPAGAVAARTLALAGVEVLLVERGAFPRNKPCGGGLTVRARSRFPWLDAVLAEVDVHAVGALHLESPDKSLLKIESPEPVGLLVRRVEFDHALVREAQRAGARLRERFEITQASADEGGVTLQSRTGDRLRAPVVVAADGVHSVIAKRLGVNARWPATSLAIDMMEETPVETLRTPTPGVAWVSYAYQGLDGYAYIFPKTKHVNIGIGCLLSHFKGEMPGRPYEMQSSLVRSLVESGALEGRSERKNFTPYLIPVGGPLRSAYRGRVLFAGDAGGFVNGFTAEGIYYSMIAGELAGKAIASNPDAPGPRYDRLWRREIGAELRDSVYVQKFLFSKHDRVNRFVRLGQRSRWLPRAVIDYTSGRRTYRQVRRDVLLRAPLKALRLLWESRSES